MKIAITQLNYHIANFEKNLNAMVKELRAAEKRGVDLILFSELAVCGYPPLDLLEQSDFIEACQASVKRFAALTRETGVIVGAPALNPNERGKKLYNAAYLLHQGEIKAIRYKTLLPTYDIFDEYRYFEPNTHFKTVSFKDKKIALTICEDLWDDQPVASVRERSLLYRISPMEQLQKQHPDLIVNISASPFAANRLEARDQVMQDHAKKQGIPLFYANQVGAHTELIFDGGSMVLDASGEKRDQFTPFTEETRDYRLEDLFQPGATGAATEKPVQYSEEYRIEMIYRALIFGIRDFFAKMNFKGATLGLSGGIDSAVTLVLASEALGCENIHVLLLPSKYSSAHSITDSVVLARNLNIKWSKVEIEPVVQSVNQQMAPLFKEYAPDITEENIQARARGLMLMALANKTGYILLNTSNKSEAAVGYATLYGDMNGGLSVLGDVYKSDVYRLARHINREREIIPESILRKPPSAELRPDQKDSDSLPDYEVLDTILYRYIEQKDPVAEIAASGFPEATVKKVISLVNRSEFKRFQAPPILRVSSKAFGIGRRMPLVAKY